MRLTYFHDTVVELAQEHNWITKHLTKTLQGLVESAHEEFGGIINELNDIKNNIIECTKNGLKEYHVKDSDNRSLVWRRFVAKWAEMMGFEADLESSYTKKIVICWEDYP